MKGIAHFSIGIAAASFFPEAVKAGAAGHPLYFLLGGFFGLLPDTIDFKFSRFLFRHDITVTPDPAAIDTQQIAEATAEAANRAFLSGKPVRIKLNTIPLGPDLWQRYTVRFDVPSGAVKVSAGPTVDTGGNPEHDSPKPDIPPGEAQTIAPLKLDYEAETVIDIFDGPVFEMTPSEDGRVTPVFIPWHRKWSHSVITALLFALTTAALTDPLAGIVTFTAYTGHAFADQLGFLGGALLFPFKKKRYPGLGIMHSGNSLWNISAVWLSCILIFRNLYIQLPWKTAGPNLMQFLIFGFALPAILLFLIHKKLTRTTDHPEIHPPENS